MRTDGIYIKEQRENATKEGVVVSTTIEFSEVDVPLCKDAQLSFYNRPTGTFTASIWTDPTYGGTSIKMKSIDDYGWVSRTSKFIDPESVKKIMLAYLEQITEAGASKENWKAYFCNKLGFGFDTLN